jgi:arylsulfatase
MSPRALIAPAIAFLSVLNGAIAAKPNVILILVDDMGWSDIGCYGSEVSTPNIDALATNGVRFRQFYNNARCSPTRCSLLTGLYTQQSSVDPGAALTKIRTDNNVTIAEALKLAGYRTYMAGKWHIGTTTPQLPESRGFDHMFKLKVESDSMLPNSWAQDDYKVVSQNNEIAFRNYTAAGQTFYEPSAVADYTNTFIDHNQAKGDGAPFFIYLPFFAPHFPLHAPQATIDKYIDTYTKGWDVLRQERFAKQQAIGAVTSGAVLTPRGGMAQTGNEAVAEIPAWDTIAANRKADLIRRMSVYAAMIEEVDKSVGRIVDHLRDIGQLDNTIIMFLSDNGANCENGRYGTGNDGTALSGTQLANMGLAGGPNLWIGGAWSNLSNTPLRYYKIIAHEGGTRTPFIVHWPAGFTAKNVWRDQPGHIIDIMPTLLAAAGATYPTTYAGHPVLPMEGRNLLPEIADGTVLPERALFAEQYWNRSVRKGDWKLVSKNFYSFDGTSPANELELYNMAADPCETNNLATANPLKVKELASDWNAWAVRAYTPVVRSFFDPPRNATSGHTGGDLFVDTFNRPNSNNIDSSMTGSSGSRTSSLPANSAWTEAFEASGADSTQINNNMLQMATGPGMAEVSVNHNFIGQDILDAGGFSVSLDIRKIDTAPTEIPNRYIGFGIGMNVTQALKGADIDTTTVSPHSFRGNTGNAGTTDCFVELDLDGNVKVWAGGAIRATVPVGKNFGTLTAAFECMSFAQGSPVKVSVYFNGSRLDLAPSNASVDTFTFNWNEANANYIGISTRATNFGQMDNFAVRKLPLADGLAVDYALRSGLDGDASEPTADNDADDSDNRTEWAFGTDPAKFDQQPAGPSMTLATGFAQISHTRLKDAEKAGVHFRYDVSEDLVNWSEREPVEVSATDVPGSADYENVILSLPESSPENHDRLFIRMSLEE